jgi:hypothetical protein
MLSQAVVSLIQLIDDDVTSTCVSLVLHELDDDVMSTCVKIMIIL